MFCYLGVHCNILYVVRWNLTLFEETHPPWLYISNGLLTAKLHSRAHDMYTFAWILYTMYECIYDMHELWCVHMYNVYINIDGWMADCILYVKQQLKRRRHVKTHVNTILRVLSINKIKLDTKIASYRSIDTLEFSKHIVSTQKIVKAF